MAGPRLAILADDLIWSTRLVAAARAAGAEPVAVRTAQALGAATATGSAGDIGLVIVDLTARAYDGIDAIAAAVAAGASVLAIGQHDDLALRKRAIAAGASRVLAYRKLADDGPGAIRAWLERAVPRPSATAGTPAR